MSTFILLLLVHLAKTMTLPCVTLKPGTLAILTAQRSKIKITKPLFKYGWVTLLLNSIFSITLQCKKGSEMPKNIFKMTLNEEVVTLRLPLC
uniref:Uncharacterized protein n=1 Tax=Seriola dumerili TaxID=41447 RepID=A0A3B4UQZ1_SERDU